MPPKKDVKKGAVMGNYKAGKPLKDILPANSKPPREGTVVKVEGEPEINRTYEFEPMPMFPEWPGNEDAKTHDYTSGCKKTEEGELILFEDQSTETVALPPSFREFVREEKNMLRPKEYIREILWEQEQERQRREKKNASQTRKTMRKAQLMNLGRPSLDDNLKDNQGNDAMNRHDAIKAAKKEDLVVQEAIIAFQERLETEEEVRKRKEEAEKAAADQKTNKKKAPPKGQVAVDPLDEAQMIKVPIENSLDMGFSMPNYTKWVTSQLQLVKDRCMRDIDTNECIWQRIYPQENGLPIISASGKYWVKLRFMGKERLIEIDDRMPCDYRKKPIFPRTINAMEIWPQILMKALLKVYSYKWFSETAQFDTETGDGSIIYSLTGLIPEHVTISDFKAQGMPLFRRLLQDDQYFGKKTYITCYCENDARPKLPSQKASLQGVNLLGVDKTTWNEETKTQMSEDQSDTISQVSLNSSQRMLSRLKDAASLAISVTTGKRPKISEPRGKNTSNVIPGFGYAMLDIFENEFVDMESIIRRPEEVEEAASPFVSPGKRSAAARKMRGDLTKDEYRRKRREEKKKELDELERRELEPPVEHSLLKIKTAVCRYPIINYIPPFSNDEIQEGKRCLINHFRRPPESTYLARSLSLLSHRKQSRDCKSPDFKLNVSRVEQKPEGQVDQTPASKAALDKFQTPAKGQDMAEIQESLEQEEQKKEEIKPKTRAPGGVWLQSSDFPHCFNKLIVYHNPNRYSHSELHSDIWTDGANPYHANENDVYLKFEIDDEAVKKFEEEQRVAAEQSQPPTQRDSAQDEEQKEEETKALERVMLPGEKSSTALNPDQILICFSPFPTKQAKPVLPRYLCKIKNHVDQQEQSTDIMDHRFAKYLEGTQLQLSESLQRQRIIWMKPTFIAPQGYTLWLASQLRKISIVSRNEFMQTQNQNYLKQYTADFLPQEKGKYHMFVKYDFKVTQEDTVVNFKVSNPNDKFLTDFMRLKIIDKKSTDDAPNLYHCKDQTAVSSMQIENYTFQPNEHGYSIIIEGNMPYRTTEGTLHIDVLSNCETFALEECVHCEPVEYGDKYTPSKYGIIFKEKILISPTDNTSASLNIKLNKNDQEFASLDMHKHFKLEILDNNNVIFQKWAFDQLTLSHFMFRSNQGLPETAPEDNPNAEVKHNYVIQAIFDLSMWEECKTENEQSENVSWCMKVFSSETMAIFKDTDKEDREKALKASWETNEPGRQEKAQKSRQRFNLQKKIAAGEQLTEEEQELLKEKRERIKKKDMEEVAAAKNTKGNKGKVPDKKGGKTAQVQPEQTEEDEAAKRMLPEPQNHVNNDIVEFLQHFKRDRQIHIKMEDKLKNATTLTDEQNAELNDQRQKLRETQQQEYEKHVEKRLALKESMNQFTQTVFKPIENERDQYKQKMEKTMEERNQYRDMIATRKEKEKAVLDLLAQEKIDIATLQSAIEQAQENLVKDEVIEKANKQLKWLKYCKEREQQLQTAIHEKVKENLISILEIIEKESIIVEPKMLTDAKNTLSKLK